MVSIGNMNDRMNAGYMYDAFGSGTTPTEFNYENESSGRLLRTVVTGNRFGLDTRAEFDLMSLILGGYARSGSAALFDFYYEGDHTYNAESGKFSLFKQTVLGWRGDLPLTLGDTGKLLGTVGVRLNGGVEVMWRNEPSLHLRIGMVRVPRSAFVLDMKQPFHYWGDDSALQGISLAIAHTSSSLMSGKYGPRFLNDHGYLDMTEYSNWFPRVELLFSNRAGTKVATVYGETRVHNKGDGGKTDEQLPAYGTNPLRGGVTFATSSSDFTSSFTATVEANYAEKISPDDTAGNMADLAFKVGWRKQLYKGADGTTVDFFAEAYESGYRAWKARGADFGDVGGTIGWNFNLPKNHTKGSAAFNGDRAPVITNPSVYANRTYTVVPTAIELQHIWANPTGGQHQVVMHAQVPFNFYFANYQGKPRFYIRVRDLEAAIYEQLFGANWRKMDPQPPGLAGKLKVAGMKLVDQAHGNTEYTLSGERDLTTTDDMIEVPQEVVDAIHIDNQLRGYVDIFFALDTSGVNPKAVPPKSPASGYRINAYVTAWLQP